MAQLSISLSESEKADVSEVRIDGIVDTNTAGELEETIETLLKRERFRIIIDLAGVEYISSAGWGAIISKIREIRKKQGDIILSGMVANVREVFELLEFDNLLKQFKSLDDARGSFGIAVPKSDGKKKEHNISRLEIHETPYSPNGANYRSGSEMPLPYHRHGSIEDLLVRSIENDPFMSISEMVLHVNNLSDTAGVGWWKVFKLLKKNKLLSRRARFRLARQSMKG